jgi:coatomer subunit beta'
LLSTCHLTLTPESLIFRRDGIRSKRMSPPIVSYILTETKIHLTKCVQKKLFSKSDRVKSVDYHPTEPYLLAGHYNGTVSIYNHETGAIVKNFEVAKGPVRSVKFIARKNWFIAGSDDSQLRVFDYNTQERVAAFAAHSDFIRGLAVHPSASIVLSGSDDKSIKAWDWNQGWKNVQVSTRVSMSKSLF